MSTAVTARGTKVAPITPGGNQHERGGISTIIRRTVFRGADGRNSPETRCVNPSLKPPVYTTAKIMEPWDTYEGEGEGGVAKRWQKLQSSTTCAEWGRSFPPRQGGPSTVKQSPRKTAPLFVFAEEYEKIQTSHKKYKSSLKNWKIQKSHCISYSWRQTMYKCSIYIYRCFKINIKKTNDLITAWASIRCISKNI